jgi:trigger factor
MQVSFEKLDGLKRQIKAVMPTDQVEALRSAEAQKLSKQVRLQGFRPGKAPVKLVRKMYIDDINGRILNTAFDDAFKQASAENEFRIAGQAMIDDVKMEDNQPLEMTASFDVYPDVEPKDIAGVEVEQVNSSVSDENLEEMIARLQKQHAEYSATDEPAQTDDRITIDFEGKIDGEVFEGGTGEDMTIEVGGGQMLPDFDNGLLGLSPGEEKVIDVTFPDEYQAENLQGKTAQFTLKCKGLERPTLPEINDEFAEKFGVDSADKFKTDLLDNMNRELSDRVRSENKQAVLDKWLESNEFDVPEALVQQEVEVLAKDMGIGEPPKGTDMQKHHETLSTIFADRAKKRVGLGLLMGAYITKSEMTVEDERLEKRLEELSASYQDPEEVKQHYTNDSQANASLRALVLEEQVVDTLLGQAKVKTVDKPFTEIMQQQQNPLG